MQVEKSDSYDILYMKQEREDIMEKNIAVIIRVEVGQEPQAKFVGTIQECKAALFNWVIPSSMARNIQQTDSDYGYCFRLEEWVERSWRKVEYYLQIPKMDM